MLSLSLSAKALLIFLIGCISNVSSFITVSNSRAVVHTRNTNAPNLATTTLLHKSHVAAAITISSSTSLSMGANTDGREQGVIILPLVMLGCIWLFRCV